MNEISKALGYFSGVSYIRPDLEGSTVLMTVGLIHVLDAGLCYFISDARLGHRRLWALLGLLLGVWVLLPLFFLSERQRGEESGGRRDEGV